MVDKTPLAVIVADPEPLNREDAELALARRIYEAMEHLEPSSPGEAIPWDDLTSREREYYRLSIRAVFSERKLCQLAAR